MAGVITLRIDVDGESYLLPTYKDSSIQITKRIQSIDAIESTQGTITKQTFRIPLIDEAIEAFGDLTELEVLPKIDIRKSIKGSILVDGFPRFDGSFQIINIFNSPQSKLKEIDLIFIGNETNLKSELSKIELSDLLEGELIQYSVGQISQYINDTDNYISGGYAFPLIDYGQKFAEDGSGRRIYNSNFPLSQLDFKPAIFMRKIFEMLPIPITVDPSAADLLKQIIPLHNSERRYPTLDTSPSDFTGNLNLTSDIDFTNFTLVGDASKVFNTIDFDAAFNYNQNSFSTANDTYEAGITGTHAVSYRFPIKFKSTIPAYVAFQLVMFEHNTNNVVKYFNQTNLISGGVFKTYGSNDYSELVNLERGKIYDIRYSIFAYQSISIGEDVDYSILSGAKFSVDTTPGLKPTSNVDVAKCIPKLTAWDCVKTIIAQCNGILEPTEDGYNIKPWVKWIDEGEVFNIEDKIDSKSDVEIEPTSVTGAKSIKLTYQEDEDFLNKLYKSNVDEVYGTASVDDTGTDFTDKEFKIDIPFAPTPMTYIAGTNVIIPKLLNDELNTIKGKPRLLFHSDFSPLGSNRMGGEIALKDLFFATPATINVGLPFVGHWENINGGYDTRDYNFGTSLNFFASSNFPNNTLYERFWKRYIQETNGYKSRLVKLNLKLSQTEFDALKLNEKVYYNNSLFSFIEIDNFDLVNENVVSCKMVLRNTIENADIAPYYPYDIINSVVQFKDSSNNSIITTPNAADLEESCNAYGYFYDSALNQCVQRGGIIQI